MNNKNVVIHRIKSGDNLYHIAQKYNTTVDEILRNNPNIDPYRLIVNTDIYIYPNHNMHHKSTLKEDMRKLWMEHVFWTRQLIISILGNLNDTNEVTNRLLRNPKEMANIFGKYYGNDVAKNIEQLLTEHLVIGDQLIRALKDNDINNANQLNREWYKNADNIAQALASINPNYDVNELKDMLYHHLDLVKQEVSSRLNGNLSADINAADSATNQAVDMADMFTNGIIKQFKL